MVLKKQTKNRGSSPFFLARSTPSVGIDTENKQTYTEMLSRNKKTLLLYIYTRFWPADFLLMLFSFFLLIDIDGLMDGPPFFFCTSWDGWVGGWNGNV